MFGLLSIVAVAILVMVWKTANPDVSVRPSKLESQLDKLWDISFGAIKDKKYLRAEKALLTILRADERNARAYNRLGILYAKQQQYNDSIECFEIAQSLEPSASSLHNVGLIYLEVGQLEKAQQAFEQALQIEGDVASRHIAYAKVLERLGDTKKMIAELETAVNLERNPQSLGILADALERTGDADRADKCRRIASKMAEKGNRTRVKQPRKVNI
ncbi:MAG: tetratricopeptide repeat protein [Candidatus Saccharibacteria bacterium]|nr:tetratricopeptide repeat protein [Candidatus Saccharibacteria bacterium]